MICVNASSCAFSTMQHALNCEHYRAQLPICQARHSSFIAKDRPRSQPIDGDVANVYLLGNSVTRHYAFALRDMLTLSTIKEPSSELDRGSEKRLCHGVLGDDSTCTLTASRSSGAHSDITFMWKMLIGIVHTTDDRRDACKKWWHRTKRWLWNDHGCYQNLFQNATRDDVLIVGSLLTNLTSFFAMGGNSDSPGGLPELAVRAAEASAGGADGRVLLSWLLAAFPGRVLWHSYAWVDMNQSKWSRTWVPWDMNPCIAYVDETARCAVESLNHPRLGFLDLRDLQKKHPDGYVDIIHHPGTLSEDIVRAMLQTLKAMDETGRPRYS